MDDTRRNYLRRQKVNVEELGKLGDILLEKAELGITPIFRTGKAVAMVIEINAFDRDWELTREPKKRGGDAVDEQLLKYLDEQDPETGRPTK
ncbi:MAG: hypothetical protein ABJ370_07445 [Paracoccaceae bacterium]